MEKPMFSLLTTGRRLVGNCSRADASVPIGLRSNVRELLGLHRTKVPSAHADAIKVSVGSEKTQ